MEIKQEMCRDCEGKGEILGQKCKHCDGTGYVNIKQTNQFNYCGYCGTPLNKQPLCPKCGRTNR